MSDNTSRVRHLFVHGPLPKVASGWGNKKSWLSDETAREFIEAGLVAERRRRIDGVTRRCLVWTGPDEAPAQPQRFALGDVVQLKSGGFAMTVISCGCGETYECAWLPAITADMPRDALGDLPCFYIPGACLKAFVDHDDNIPF